MSPALIIAAISICAALSAWAAQRDLQLPIWLTLGAFAATTTAASLAFDITIAPLSALTITCILIAEADRRHQLIPDFLVLSALALAPVMPFGDALTDRVIGAIALGGTFLLIRQTGAALSHREALGLGDVKLAAAIGAVLGPLYGFAAVALAGIATILVVTVRAGNSTIAAGAPFGIGLATATATVALIRLIAP